MLTGYTKSWAGRVNTIVRQTVIIISLFLFGPWQQCRGFFYGIKFRKALFLY